uniref:Uncharacterized protein n=1 Tax=Peronospora matthiolae TaxID=2874970 RepID=A0AAV1UCW8_9STRA
MYTLLEPVGRSLPPQSERNADGQGLGRHVSTSCSYVVHVSSELQVAQASPADSPHNRKAHARATILGTLVTDPRIGCGLLRAAVEGRNRLSATR